MKAKNDTALTTKAHVNEVAAMMTAASAGPTTLPRLYWVEPSDAAANSSSRGTRSGIIAW
jgi:hypothetical protein